MSDEYDEYEHEEEEPERPRDQKIDKAKKALLKRYFQEKSKEVYYGRQLEIWLQAEFFHWITKKTLNELVDERQIGFQEDRLEHHVAHFYYARQHRYPRRQIGRTIRLIAEFSNPTLTRVVGVLALPQ